MVLLLFVEGAAVGNATSAPLAYGQIKEFRIGWPRLVFKLRLLDDPESGSSELWLLAAGVCVLFPTQNSHSPNRPNLLSS